MEKVKLAIVFYSQTGVNWKMAQWAADTAREAGAEVRLRKVAELRDTSEVREGSDWAKVIEETKDIEIATPEDLAWADAIVISSPTRYGNIASQMKDYFDSLGGVWSQGLLVNKFVTAFSSAQNNNGGQEQAIHAIYTSAMHWGSIIVPTGYTNDAIFAQGGNPYGVTATQDHGSVTKNDVEGAVRHQVKRLLDVTSKYIS